MDRKTEKNQHMHTILLAVLIIIQCLFYVYMFTVKKTGYHEDEYFQYGLSNSYKYPFLYGSDLQVTDNYDVWLTGDDFKYYIRTNDDTKFRYDSVWYNQTMDTNPPLSYAILHTISSVFSGSFSWWYAFSINLLSFILSQIFLYLLVIQLCRSKNTALFVCAVWAFTLSAQGDFLFIRMYAMLTALSVMYAYFSVRIVTRESCGAGSYAAITLTALIGALTQHLFLMFAFLITAFECIYLLIRKHFKSFFIYGFSAAMGFAISFVIFPATFDHLFHSRFEYSEVPDTHDQLRQLASLMMKSTVGITTAELKASMFYVKICLLFGLPLLLPLIFLFRTSLLRFVRKIPSRFREIIPSAKSVLPQMIIMLLTSIAFLVIVCSKFYYYDFGEDSIRYVYLIMPFLTALLICIPYLLLRAIGASKIRFALDSILAICMCGLIVLQNVRFDPRYVICADPDNGSVSEYAAEESCILLTLNPIYMPIYCRMLEDAGDVYETYMTDDYYREKKHISEYNKLFERNEPFILIFDSSILFEEDFYEKVKASEPDLFNLLAIKQYGENWRESDIVSYFEGLSGYTALYCTAETTHFNRIVVYRFTPQ